MEQTAGGSSRTASEDAPRAGRRLIIVRRDELALYDYLRSQFSGDKQVEILLDRRRGERRHRVEVHQPERRGADRRQCAIADEDLRAHGFAVVRRKPEGTRLREIEPPRGFSRRIFLKAASGVAAAAMLPGVGHGSPGAREIKQGNCLRLPARVHFRESVTLRLGAERGFLFDQRTGQIYSLNSSGTFAAARIQAGDPVPAVIAAVTDAFDVDRETAERDFDRLVTQLAVEGLVDVDG